MLPTSSKRFNSREKSVPSRRNFRAYSEYWRNTERKKILSISNHTCFPVTAGGHQRIFNINSELMNFGFSILQFSEAVRKGEMTKLRSLDFDIAADFFELHHFRPFFQAANVSLERKHLPPLFFSRYSGRAWSNRRLKRHIPEADILIVEHPWLFPAPRTETGTGVGNRIPVVQNSHNIEYDLFDQMLDTRQLRRHLGEIFAAEKRAFESASANLVCSELDRQRAIELYGIDESNIHVIPNGVTVPARRQVDGSAQSRLRRQHGIRDISTLLFVGSAHPPNVAGMRKLLSLFDNSAQQDFQLLVLGDAASSLPPALADWVVPIGRVESLDDYFQMADIALNPVLEGGGTNIKMLDYMAQSMPIISTPMGARGLGMTAGVEAEIVEIDAFPVAIRALIANQERQIELAAAAWALAQQRFSWQPIAARMAAILDPLIHPSGVVPQ